MKAILIGGALAVAALICLGNAESEAMTACLKAYSYDTCATTLHR